MRRGIILIAALAAWVLWMLSQDAAPPARPDSPRGRRAAAADASPSPAKAVHTVPHRESSGEPDTIRVIGRVNDPVDSVPIANAQVKLVGPSADRPLLLRDLGRVLSDLDGVFAMELGPEEIRSLRTGRAFLWINRFSAGRSRYEECVSPVTIAESPPPIVDLGSFSLPDPQGGRIVGVISVRGRPTTAAEVSMWATGSVSRPPLRLRTQRDGTFAAEGLSAGPEEPMIEARVTVKARTAIARHNREAPPREALTWDDPDPYRIVRVPRGGGTVVDFDLQAPLRGEIVTHWVIEPWHRHLSSLVPIVEDGRTLTLAEVGRQARYASRVPKVEPLRGSGIRALVRDGADLYACPLRFRPTDEDPTRFHGVIDVAAGRRTPAFPVSIPVRADARLEPKDDRNCYVWARLHEDDEELFQNGTLERNGDRLAARFPALPPGRYVVTVMTGTSLIGWISAERPGSVVTVGTDGQVHTARPLDVMGLRAEHKDD